MKETFYVMGKNKMGAQAEQLNEQGFETRAEAVWFAKRMSGQYRWTSIVTHTR